MRLWYVGANSTNNGSYGMSFVSLVTVEITGDSSSISDTSAQLVAFSDQSGDSTATIIALAQLEAYSNQVGLSTNDSTVTAQGETLASGEFTGISNSSSEVMALQEGSSAIQTGLSVSTSNVSGELKERTVSPSNFLLFFF